jgi:hypothetical protein
MSGHVMIPVAVGELFDKISILEIKQERINDPEKLTNIRDELSLLNRIADKLDISSRADVITMRRDLKIINEAIWDAENLVREVASREGFGASFADVAKTTYQNNDRRASIKRKLSLVSGSLILEEKSHAGGGRLIQEQT